MRNTILDFISLQQGEEKREVVMRDVRENISFRNANLWILVFAILIASIGLNVNSTAVIIGAMLISPLMGPIVGAGFALATYDFELLKRALKNLVIATFVSLFVAGLYFFISPFKETQSELLARTAPNIYDVLIAFLGGLVGVISLTRVDKGNPIPGVAIATALMPPLCTAGYGLAIGNWNYFFGAFYLYTINCFFICIATFFITKYLKYPPVQTVNKKHDRQIQRTISILVLIMIVPSSYLAYDLWQEKKFIQNAEQFLDTEFNRRGHVIVFKKIRYHTTPKIIELAFLTKTFEATEIDRIRSRMKDFQLQQAELIINQDERDLKGEILEEINSQEFEITQKNKIIDDLNSRLKKFSPSDKTIKNELKILFPEIREFSIGRNLVNADTSKTRLLFVYEHHPSKIPDEKKLAAWLNAKWKDENLLILKK